MIAIPQFSLSLISWASFALARIVMITWAAVTGIVYANQRSLLYFPNPDRVAPQAAGLTGVTEQTLKTPDGETLIAWYAAPRAGKPVILYFHGNGGNLAVRAMRIKLFQEAGYGVLMPSYRGYSGSTGSPSEPALTADAKLTSDWLVNKGTKPADIVLFGESLGTGLAVKMAAEHPVRAVILDSPYTSIVEAAQAHYSYLPVSWLMWDRYNSIARIKLVRAPLMVIHGTLDHVVPYELGQKLYAAASEPKRLVTLTGQGHVAPLRNGAWPEIQAFLAANDDRTNFLEK